MHILDGHKAPVDIVKISGIYQFTSRDLVHQQYVHGFVPHFHWISSPFGDGKSVLTFITGPYINPLRCVSQNSQLRLNGCFQK